MDQSVIPNYGGQQGAGTSIPLSSLMQMFGAQPIVSEPTAFDNRFAPPGGNWNTSGDDPNAINRDYGKYPASLAEKISGLARIYGMLGKDWIGLSQRPSK
jgi:hypothetical protein